MHAFCDHAYFQIRDLTLAGFHDVLRLKQGGDQPSENWLDKWSPVINVIYEPIYVYEEPWLQLKSIPGPLPMGGEKRRRWRTRGRASGVRGRNWMRGTERNWEEPPQQNLCSIQALHTGSSPVLSAWPLSRCESNWCCCVKIVWRKQRRLSAWERWTV